LPFLTDTSEWDLNKLLNTGTSDLFKQTSSGENIDYQQEGYSEVGQLSLKDYSLNELEMVSEILSPFDSYKTAASQL
jgi:hypothetical protein